MADRPVDDGVVQLNLESLTAAAQGDPTEAAAFADRAADAGSLLGVALSTYLRTSKQPDVYDRPAAFEAFIAGGGNVELYRRTSTTLAGAYRGVSSLLDIGTGNGLALIPAMHTAGPDAPTAVELVEPSADLLGHCVDGISQAGLPVQVTAWQLGLTEFLAAAPTAQRWELAESTFALQSIEPRERLAALSALAHRVDKIVVVDFDVPADKPGGPQQIRRLAAAYERGLAEYDETRELVAQGFLIPVLLGQLARSTPRTNWEQPAEKWRDEFEAAGFQDIDTRELADYWSAPAFVLTANGALQERDQEPWDGGDLMTPDNWAMQEKLGRVHTSLREISDADPTASHGRYISARIDRHQQGVTVWWFGPLPPGARSVIDRARADDITVDIVSAPFSRAQLDLALQQIMAGTSQVEIGCTEWMRNTDGSGVTVCFGSTRQAAAAIEAVDRIRAAAASGAEPTLADQKFRALYTDSGPVITIDPEPMIFTPFQSSRPVSTPQPGSAPATT